MIKDKYHVRGNRLGTLYLNVFRCFVNEFEFLALFEKDYLLRNPTDCEILSAVRLLNIYLSRLYMVIKFFYSIFQVCDNNIFPQKYPPFYFKLDFKLNSFHKSVIFFSFSFQ